MLLTEKQLKSLIRKVIRECLFSEEIKTTPSGIERTKKFIEHLNRQNRFMFSAVEIGPGQKSVIVKHPKGGIVEVIPMEEKEKLILRGKDARGASTQATSVSMFAEPKDIYRELLDMVGMEEKPGLPLNVNEQKKAKK